MNNDFYQYAELMPVLRTVNDVELFTQEIEELQQSLYKTIDGFENTLFQKVRVSVAQAIQSILKQQGTNASDVISTGRALAEMLSDMQALPVVRLTLALEPPGQLLEDISDFVRREIAARAVLSIVVDQKILGGILVDYEGRYWDYSVRKVFGEVISYKL